MKNKPRVLFVDDEPDLLKSIKLNLRKDYHVDLANSGKEGLERIASSERYAVIVSDMRMPEMNGAKFLELARKVSKASSRILLTGETDLTSAIEAVNKGSIFRFLKKPCDLPDLIESLEAGVEQYRLVNAERELLQNTLRSSVRLLTDILGHVHPHAFSRSARIYKIVGHMAGKLGLQSVWVYEIAGMLAHLGLVTIPSEIVQKDCAGSPLEDWERDLLESHPRIGAEMVESIPRLERVASMIVRQNIVAEEEELQGDPSDWSPAVLGGELLRVAAAFEREASASGDNVRAIKALNGHAPAYHEALLSCLEGYEIDPGSMSVSSRTISQLRNGMILQQDVHSTSGGLLATHGQTVDPTFIQRLRNFDRSVGVQQPIRVLIPISLLTKSA